MLGVESMLGIEMSRTQKIVVYSLVAAFSLFIALFLAFILLGLWVDYNLGFRWESHRWITLTSPDSKHTAYLCPWRARDESGVDLYVLISPGCVKRVNEKKRVLHLADVVWSKDGSVIALREGWCILAYDFATGETIGDHRDVMPEDPPPDWIGPGETWEKIETLLSERDGTGKSLSYCESDCIPMGYWEWKEFNKALKAGREFDRAKEEEERERERNGTRGISEGGERK